MQLAIRPSPLLPSLYLAGEAFSSYQAWIEGALETAEMALAAFEKDRESPVSFPTGSATTVVIEGFEIDVSKWFEVHPGGRHAIENHLGEDVGELMKHIGHSAHAWAVVHSLKISERVFP